MENLRIFESLIILNERIEGFLARIDFLSNDPENPKSELKFLATLQENKKIMKDKRLFYEHFPEDKRDGLKTILKPWTSCGRSPSCWHTHCSWRLSISWSLFIWILCPSFNHYDVSQFNEIKLNFCNRIYVILGI